jgi:hypothetical protein
MSAAYTSPIPCAEVSGSPVCDVDDCTAELQAPFTETLSLLQRVVTADGPTEAQLICQPQRGSTLPKQVDICKMLEDLQQH